MKSPERLPRLLETLTEEGELLRVGLEEARAELPNAQQLARLRSRFWPGGGGPPGQGGPSDPPAMPPSPGPAGTSTPPHTTGAGPGTAKASFVGTVKAAGITAVAGIAVVLLAHYWDRGDVAPTRTPTIATVGVSASEQAVQPDMPKEPGPMREADRSRGAGTGATNEPTHLTTGAGAMAPHRQASPPAPRAQPPGFGRAVSPALTAGPSAAEESRSGQPGDARAAAAANAPAMPTDHPSEIELLREAQASAGSNPARALALVTKAALLYPNGALVQEREMIRIQVLAASGRSDEARAEAVAFRKRHPGSPYCRRLETLFADLDSL